MDTDAVLSQTEFTKKDEKHPSVSNRANARGISCHMPVVSSKSEYSGNYDEDVFDEMMYEVAPTHHLSKPICTDNWYPNEYDMCCGRPFFLHKGLPPRYQEVDSRTCSDIPGSFSSVHFKHVCHHPRPNRRGHTTTETPGRK